MRLRIKNIFKNNNQEYKGNPMLFTSAFNPQGRPPAFKLEQRIDKRILLAQYFQSASLYRAIKIISEVIAGTDIRVMRVRNMAGETTEIFNSPIFQYLDTNQEGDINKLIEKTIVHRLLTGEAYWYTGGDILQIIRPDLINAKLNKDGNILYYEAHDIQGTPIQVSPEEIIDFSNTNPLSTAGGVSPLEAAKSIVMSEIKAEQYQINVFDNNGTPDTIVYKDNGMQAYGGKGFGNITNSNVQGHGRGTLEANKQMEQQDNWDRQFRGVANAGKTLTSNDKLGAIKLGSNPKEMDYVASVQFTEKQIGIVFGIPYGIFHSEMVSRADGENAINNFVRFTLSPIVSDIESLLNRQYIPEIDFTAFLQFDNLFDDDINIKTERLLSMVDKIMTRNEVRKELNLPPLKKGGDTLYLPQGDIDIQQEHPRQIPTQARNAIQRRDVLRNFLDVKEKYMNYELSKKKLLIQNQVSRRGRYIQQANADRDNSEIEVKRVTRSLFEKQQNNFLKELNDVYSDIQALGNKTEIREYFEDNFDLEDRDYTIYREGMEREMKRLIRVAGARAINYARSIRRNQVEPEEITILNKTQKVIDNYLEEEGSGLAITSTRKQQMATVAIDAVESGLSSREAAAKYHDFFNNNIDERLDIIARTTTTYIDAEGVQNAIDDDEDVNAKEWITVGDQYVRPEHRQVDGEVVEKGENFSNGLSHPEGVNCRCTMAGVYAE